MIKLSNTSKMPCPSWSLEAIATCPGSRDPKTGGLVPVCQGCYATTGQYNFPSVKGPRKHNREDWKEEDWADRMVAAISKYPYFRWFDSGDVYVPELAYKILQVMRATPNTQHWLPTRSHKFKKIKVWLTKMKRLPNVAVRYSSDHVDQFNKNLHGSVVVSEDSYKHDLRINLHTFRCFAYTREGKCGDCRACWDKTIPTIAYPAHGGKMEKVVNKG